MSLLDKYKEWSGQGAHQASGNVKNVGDVGTDFFDNTYAKGFIINKKQGETDFNLDKVEGEDIPSSKLASRKFDSSKSYSDSMTDK